MRDENGVTRSFGGGTVAESISIMPGPLCRETKRRQLSGANFKCTRYSVPTEADTKTRIAIPANQIIWLRTDFVIQLRRAIVAPTKSTNVAPMAIREKRSSRQLRWARRVSPQLFDLGKTKYIATHKCSNDQSLPNVGFLHSRDSIKKSHDSKVFLLHRGSSGIPTSARYFQYKVSKNYQLSSIGRG
jgi:hypothetical protein